MAVSSFWVTAGLAGLAPVLKDDTYCTRSVDWLFMLDAAAISSTRSAFLLSRLVDLPILVLSRHDSALAGTSAMKAGASARDALPHESLSGREMGIFRRIVKGQSVNAIADGLSISNKTVNTLKARFLERKGAKAQRHGYCFLA